MVGTWRAAARRRDRRRGGRRRAITQRLGARYREYRGQELDAMRRRHARRPRGRSACTTRRPTARRCAGSPRPRWPVSRLRRQRARADGRRARRSPPGSRTRRPTPAAGACVVEPPRRPSSPPGSRVPRPRSAWSTACPLGSRPDRASPRSSDDRRGASASAAVDDRPRGRSLVVLFLSRAGPRRLLHRLPLVRLRRLRRRPGAGLLWAKVRAGGRVHRRLLRADAREPHDRRPARAAHARASGPRTR